MIKQGNGDGSGRGPGSGSGTGIGLDLPSYPGYGGGDADGGHPIYDENDDCTRFSGMGFASVDFCRGEGAGCGKGHDGAGGSNGLAFASNRVDL